MPRAVCCRMKGETPDDTERARLWPLVVQMYHGYDEYQKETTRKIPVVIHYDNVP